MIVSLLLILVAVVLLAFGLVSGSNALLFGSIAASMLAAIMLYVGARQVVADQAPTTTAGPGGRAGRRPRAGDEAWARPAGRRPEPAFVPIEREPAEVAKASEIAERQEHETVGSSAAMARLLREPGPPAAAATPPEARSHAPAATTEAAEAKHGGAGPAGVADAVSAADEDDYDDEDPPDEPAAQEVSAPVATRLARLSAEVLVVDGRPRYHLAGCDHLHGRQSEPLPVSEAVELGFTPCNQCQPVRALLAYTQPA